MDFELPNGLPERKHAYFARIPSSEPGHGIQDRPKYITSLPNPLRLLLRPWPDHELEQRCALVLRGSLQPTETTNPLASRGTAGHPRAILNPPWRSGVLKPKQVSLSRPLPGLSGYMSRYPQVAIGRYDSDDQPRHDTSQGLNGVGKMPETFEPTVFPALEPRRRIYSTPCRMEVEANATDNNVLPKRRCFSLGIQPCYRLQELPVRESQAIRRKGQLPRLKANKPTSYSPNVDNAIRFDVDLSERRNSIPKRRLGREAGSTAVIRMALDSLPESPSSDAPPPRKDPHTRRWRLYKRILGRAIASTVSKITSEILPQGETMTKDARDVLIECCVEFITLISSEANEIMEQESKKTIGPEHVAKALKGLEFPEYIDEVMAVANEQKEQLKTREKRTTKMEQSGMSQEELEAAQRALFQQATEKYNQGPGE